MDNTTDLINTEKFSHHQLQDPAHIDKGLYACVYTLSEFRTHASIWQPYTIFLT